MPAEAEGEQTEAADAHVKRYAQEAHVQLFGIIGWGGFTLQPLAYVTSDDPD